MTQATQICSALAGSTLVSLPVNQRTRASVTCGTRSPVVYQQHEATLRAPNAETSRRSFMATTALSLTAVAAASLLILPSPAEAAKRKPPPPPEEKPSNDDKYMSAYDAKLLASQRRKEALKALLDGQKKKAKSIAPEPEESALELVGQATDSEG